MEDVYQKMRRFASGPDIPGVLGSEHEVVPLEYDTPRNLSHFGDFMSLDKIHGQFSERIAETRADAITDSLASFIIPDVLQIVLAYSNEPLFWVNIFADGEKCWTAPVYQLPFVAFPRGPIPRDNIFSTETISVNKFHIDADANAHLFLTNKHYLTHHHHIFGIDFDIPEWNMEKRNDRLRARQKLE